MYCKLQCKNNYFQFCDIENLAIFPQIRKIRKQLTVVIYQNWVF